jgi:hypothetical protein
MPRPEEGAYPVSLTPLIAVASGRGGGFANRAKGATTGHPQFMLATLLLAAIIVLFVDLSVHVSTCPIMNGGR